MGLLYNTLLEHDVGIDGFLVFVWKNSCVSVDKP